MVPLWDQGLLARGLANGGQVSWVHPSDLAVDGCEVNVALMKDDLAPVRELKRCPECVAPGPVEDVVLSGLRAVAGPSTASRSYRRNI